MDKESLWVLHFSLGDGCSQQFLRLLLAAVEEVEATTSHPVVAR
ncbi:MAG: hypothetical protein ACRYGA_17325 [Janthinobacterium lividum]